MSEKNTAEDDAYSEEKPTVMNEDMKITWDTYLSL